MELNINVQLFSSIVDYVLNNNFFLQYKNILLKMY